MKKLNIYLPKVVHTALKEESTLRKVRMSEVVRQHIEHYFTHGEGVVRFAKGKQPRRTELQRTNLYLTESQLERINIQTEKLDCTKADFIRFILSVKTGLSHVRILEK